MATVCRSFHVSHPELGKVTVKTPAAMPAAGSPPPPPSPANGECFRGLKCWNATCKWTYPTGWSPEKAKADAGKAKEKDAKPKGAAASDVKDGKDTKKRPACNKGGHAKADCRHKHNECRRCGGMSHIEQAATEGLIEKVAPKNYTTPLGPFQFSRDQRHDS